jgi:hypothetical protein
VSVTNILLFFFGAAVVAAAKAGPKDGTREGRDGRGPGRAPVIYDAVYLVPDTISTVKYNQTGYGIPT